MKNKVIILTSITITILGLIFYTPEKAEAKKLPTDTDYSPQVCFSSGQYHAMCAYPDPSGPCYRAVWCP